MESMMKISQFKNPLFKIYKLPAKVKQKNGMRSVIMFK